MIRRIQTLFYIIILLTAATNNAQTVIGKYAGEFLAIGVGGRALGMGSAHTAVSNDVTSGYWNPAGLARIDYPQIALMHEEHFGDIINYNYGAVAIPYGKDMSFGLSVIRLSIEGIPDTREAQIDRSTGQQIFDLNHPNWGLDYSRITEFSNTDWAIYLTFAKRQSSDFYWGANVKVIQRDIAEFSATGIGFDIGAVYMPMENLYLGANVQDVTTTLVAWSTGRNELISPTTKIGATYGIEFWGGRFLPALDLDIRFENRQFASTFNVGPVSFDAKAGFEYTYQNLFSIRAGYTDVKQFTVGAGIKLPKLNIDYSFARFNETELSRLDDSHRISLILTLEELRFERDK
ncbi:MAG: PorV/PorQ family protein [Melioribacteraceae bacterium]|nr:PorV/PorQ family protein [Melioribacteraceae bacterium]MCF8354736.1 PorV/PorQ family protein [Melioribacteraceae bacterium]MCF8393242.1 PorV/PorQ family protein [Melioribacteraceae bacterium]MCF8417543.1 PorV/PorQ family protein [Melioribacteraceae bacterium]